LRKSIYPVTKKDPTAILAQARNYITKSGADRLKAELKKLLYEDRPDLVRVVSWAASNGDRSENGDYIYGKRKLREIDHKIRFLSQRLEAAEIISLPPLSHRKQALFGATVTVLDEEENEKAYRIVGQDEIDLSQGFISWVSPMARALLNSKVGDVVSLKTPDGVEDLEILSITYCE
jgi:transcription elongation factor GreB